MKQPELGKKILELRKQKGFTQEELDAAKGGIIQNNQVNRSKDGFLKSTLNNNLVYDRKMMWYAGFEDQIQSLSVEDLNAAFKKHIDIDKLNIVKAGDFDKVVSEP